MLEIHCPVRFVVALAKYINLMLSITLTLTALLLICKDISIGVVNRQIRFARDYTRRHRTSIVDFTDIMY